MALKEELRGDVAVLTLKGNLMGGPETTEVHDKVKEFTLTGIKKIVIDLSKVKWMNSTGIGALTGSLNLLNDVDGKLALANITDKIESLFVITQLSKIFSAYNSIDEAVTALED